VRIQKKLIVFSLTGLLIIGMSTLLMVKVFACTQGCTPGFWKNPKHFNYWMGFSPNDNVGVIFDIEDKWLDDYDFLKGQTLLEALQKKGGQKGMTNEQKAARILLRQAVAALLNGAHPAIDYSSPQAVINLVMGALMSTDATIIEGVKNHFRHYNELGSPLCE